MRAFACLWLSWVVSRWDIMHPGITPTPMVVILAFVALIVVAIIQDIRELNL